MKAHRLTPLTRLRQTAEAILKASALALVLLTAACSDAPTSTAPQATGMTTKAAAALQGRKSRIDQALEDAGA